MLGVCYYPEHWPEDLWADDAKRMVEVGITYVRIGEFAWSRMEPEPGRHDWGWLDRAVETLGAAGLKVVLCTPTPTPPKWLVDRIADILPVDKDGRTLRFGSRRHYTHASEEYLAASRAITSAIADRYGENPHVAGWQTDNEYGCHDSGRSYGPADLAHFRAYLKQRYGTIDALNEAWGNVFWSMEYRDFTEIELPNLTVADANPAHWLDFFRASSAAIDRFNRQQVEILRDRSPGRFITHNYMANELSFDHWRLTEPMDLASWDNYPLGFNERFNDGQARKTRFARTGDPDISAFHHDLYRGVGRGRFWVMEQQPGPVNWAPWNPDPVPGAVRLWTHDALSHGAEVVSYFRWRQAPFAQEQMHAGLNRPDNVLDRGGQEAADVARELADLGPDFTQAWRDMPRDAALVFDYQAAWALEIQPQGQDAGDYFAACLVWYRALRQAGRNVDFVPPGGDLAGYDLVVAPTLPILTEAAVAALKAADGRVIVGHRSGSKTDSFQIPQGLPPGRLRDLIAIQVTRVSSLRPGLQRPVEGPALNAGAVGAKGAIRRWSESVEPLSEMVEEALVFADDGAPALLRDGNVSYLAGWPDDDLAAALVGPPRQGTPPFDDVRVCRRGRYTVALNFGPEARDIAGLAAVGGAFVIGSERLDPYGVAVLKA